MPTLTTQINERIAAMVPRRWHHEHVYPQPDGEGGAGDNIALSTNANDKTNAAASAQYYWGEPSVILPVETETVLYYFVGAYLTLGGVAGVDVGYHINILKTSIYYCSVRNAGNAWDEGATVLTVADGSVFEVDDLVWVVSSVYTDGEVQRVTDVTGDVVTVAREASQFGAANTGLRWDHTTDGTDECMYLCQRLTDPTWFLFDVEFESGTARRNFRYIWAFPKAMPDNAGLIARMLNQTDSTNDLEIEVKIIYNHA